MTREDINRINSQYLNDCENTGEMEEIFALAIKALEQEPKPMVEIDLYSVIKQKYIEREVLDKIRAEIKEITRKYPMTWDYENGLKVALKIIDKYKEKSEVENGNDD